MASILRAWPGSKTFARDRCTLEARGRFSDIELDTSAVPDEDGMDVVIQPETMETLEYRKITGRFRRSRLVLGNNGGTLKCSSERRVKKVDEFGSPEEYEGKAEDAVDVDAPEVVLVGSGTLKDRFGRPAVTRVKVPAEKRIQLKAYMVRRNLDRNAILVYTKNFDQPFRRL